MMPLPVSMLPQVAPIVSLPKATLLFKHNMAHAYTVVQARDVKVFRAPFAQHADGVYWTFTPKGARSARTFGDGGDTTLVVVDGWQDAQVPSEYHPSVETSPGVTVAKGRAMSCSSLWADEARAAARAAGKVVFDGHAAA